MTTKNERPLSPHLQVYRLPLTALLSISHRATGVGLSLGLLLLVWLLAAAAGGPDSYATVHGIYASFLGQLIIFLFTFALYFHFCNGIRHLIWDLGYGFDMEVADRNSKIVLGAAAGLTLLTWIIALAA